MSEFSDPNDLGTLNEQRNLEVAIANTLANATKGPELPRIGKCHFCKESIGHEMLFCDCDCQADWQARRDAEKRRTGR